MTTNTGTASDEAVNALRAALTGSPIAPLVEVFGEPISIYTRAQMIADGALFPLPEKEVREQRFTCQVDATAAAWHDAMVWTEETERRKSDYTGQDTAGRVWDVLTMLNRAMRIYAARNGNAAPDELRFQVIRVPSAGRGVRARLVTLKAVFGADHTGWPTITIMMPDES